MKILVIFIISALLSTSLAESKEEKPKRKVKRQPIDRGRRGRHQKRAGPFSSAVGDVWTDHSAKLPRIPYVDDEGSGRQTSSLHQQNGLQLARPPSIGGHGGGATFQTPVHPPAARPPVGNQGASFIHISIPSQTGNNHGGNPGGGSSQVSIPPLLGKPPVNHGTQHDTPVQFEGSHPGGGIIISAPGVPVHPVNQGVEPFHPGFPAAGFPGLFPGASGTAPGFPVFPVGSAPGGSAAGGPGGMSGDSGLAGGLGGVFGGGYGFGLGGLIFGGQAGPVFAGNAALSEGTATNAENTGANEQFDDPSTQNDAVDSKPIPPFQPLGPPRGNFFNEDRGTRKPIGNQSIRGATNVQAKPSAVQHPPNGALKNSDGSGETIGYVAFIFPRRPFNRPAHNTATGSGTQKSVNEASTKLKVITKAVTSPVPKPVPTAINWPAPYFIPVPVHVPVDRPYPVPVPKAYTIFKPYPVAVPKPVPIPFPVHVAQPVPYEVAKPIAVPVPVPIEFQKSVSADVPILVGVNDPILLQPSLEPTLIHKRSYNVEPS